MKLEKLLNVFVLSMLLFKTNSILTLVYEFSLLAKKIPNGTIHCIWSPYLGHEGRLRISKQMKEIIIKENRDAIEEFAGKTNLVAYVENHDEYNNEVIKDKRLTWEIGKAYYNLFFLTQEILEKFKPDFLDNIFQFLRKNNIKFHNIDLRQDHEIYEFEMRYRIWPTIEKYFKMYTQNLYSVIFRSLTLDFFDTCVYSILLAAPASLYFATRYNDWQINLELKKMAKNSKHKKKLELLLVELYQQSKLSYILGTSDRQTLSRRNDVYTVVKILEQVQQDSLSNNRYMHSLILTGGNHSGNIEKILIDYFGYEKMYSQKVPEHVTESFNDKNPKKHKIGELLEKRLDLKKCFELGMSILKKTK